MTSSDACQKKPLPLHVSRALIAREQANVVLRTQRRIALLRANENSKDNDDNDDPVTVTVPVHTQNQNHYCISIFCFCVLLVILNLLFLQWLFYQVRHSNANAK
jgi:hypothetical protein